MNNFQFYSPTEFVFGRDTEWAEEYHQDYLDKHPGGYCHLTPAHFALAKPHSNR